MLKEKNKIEWLESIIEAVNDGILVIDKSGIVQLINEEYTNITGVTKEQIIGKPLTEVRPGAILPTVLESGKPREGVFRKEKKKEYVVDMAPIYYNDEIVGAVSVCKSMPELYVLTKELKRSKQKINQLEKAVGRMHQAKYTFSDIIGTSSFIQKVIDQAKRIAPTDLNVLITGESGIGKEIFAHAIHQKSDRKSQPFVPINCAAIPSSLLESELFGYEEGAFTNSKQEGKIGLFELANKGTLFLDEIGDMPLDLQSKLLRVLEEGTFRKIGGLTEQQIDVRIIAATNKDLSKLVQKNLFREDLLYRINTVHLSIPPLRERKEDIPEIINFIVNNHHYSNYEFDDEVKKTFLQYDWPGNVRELKNTIHYAINMSDQFIITQDDLPKSIRGAIIKNHTNNSSTRSLHKILMETEKAIIKETLEETGTTVQGKKAAAKKLGISLATLYNKIAKLKID